MPKVIIRRGVFETNSSSTHSYAIVGSGQMENPAQFSPNAFKFYADEGWSGFYSCSTSKAQYFLQSMLFWSSRHLSELFEGDGKMSIGDIQEMIKQDSHYIALEEVIYEYCGAQLEFILGFENMEEMIELSEIQDYWLYENILTANNDALPYSVVKTICDEQYKEDLKDFIFNKKYVIYCTYDG